MRTLVTAMLALAVIGLAGCTYRVGDFTMIASRNIQRDANYVQTGSAVKGADVKHMIIFIPTGYPNIEDALDDALARDGSDYMTDASLHYSYWFIPAIYGQIKFTVTGDTWKLAE